MIGTTAALIGLAAATTGADVAKAAIGSGAAKDAATIQSASADKAIDFQKQLWGQTQTNAAPYLAAGQGAATMLGGLMQPFGRNPGGAPIGGATPGGPAGMARPMPPAAPPAPSGGAITLPNGIPYDPTKAGPFAGQGGPTGRGGTPPGMDGAPGGNLGAAMMAGGPGAAPGSDPGDPLVTVQAPTGETMQMPRSKATAYLGRGARIIGGGV